MAYRVIKHDSGFVFTENTDDRRRLYQMRQRANRNAADCIEPNGAWKRDDLKGHHLLYYYEIAETNSRGEKTGWILVHIYMQPRVLSDKVFYGFVDESKPDYVGAIHL